MSCLINFADYIESDEVRNYIKETGYELSIQQCVYIILSSKSLSFEKKLKLYESLIERNIDECISEKNPSVFGVLKMYIGTAQRFLESFKSAGHFEAVLTILNGEAYTEVLEGEYNSLKELLEKVFEKGKKIKVINVAKGPFIVKIDGNGEIIEFYVKHNEEFGANDRENWILQSALDYIKSPISIPFKKGDLLEYGSDSACVLANDFVPNSDKKLSIYTAISNNIYNHDFIRLCHLKTYKGKLKEGNEILIPLSLYLKGKIKIDKLLAYYECLRMKNDFESAVEENVLGDIDMLTGYDCSNYKGEPICDKPFEFEENFSEGDEECPF